MTPYKDCLNTIAPKLINSDLFLEKCAIVPIKSLYVLCTFSHKQIINQSVLGHLWFKHDYDNIDK